MLEPSVPPLPARSLVEGSLGSMLLAVLVGRVSARAGLGRWAEGDLTDKHISDDPFLNSLRARCRAEHPPSSFVEDFCWLDDTVREADGAFSPLTMVVGWKCGLSVSKFDFVLLCCVTLPSAV